MVAGEVEHDPRVVRWKSSRETLEVGTMRRDSKK